MNKIILLSFLTLSLMSTSFAQVKIVKKETQISFVKNADGKLIPDGSEVTKYYDEMGNLIEDINKRFWSEIQKTIVYTRKYYYTSNKLDSSVLYDSAKSILKLVYEYDSTGILRDAAEILPNGNISFKTKYFYNERKNKIREQLFNADGVLFTEKNFKYDNNNNLIEESGKDKGNPRYKWVYKYDKNNFLIERKDYDGTGSLLRTHSFKKNKYGKPSEEVETTLSSSGKKIRIVKYSYEYY